MDFVSRHLCEACLPATSSSCTLDAHANPECHRPTRVEYTRLCPFFSCCFQVCQGAWLTDALGNRYLDFFAGGRHSDADLSASKPFIDITFPCLLPPPYL
jgi:hypothetical protein